MKPVVHLLSGGLDSTVLLYDLQAQGCLVHCVLFDYGQKHVQELTYAKYHCQRLRVLYTTITLTQLKGSLLTDSQGGVVVPNRNLVLLSHAINLAIAARAESVTYACNKDDEAVFADCRPAFVQCLNQLLLMAEIQIEVCAPYIDKAKWEILDLGRQLGVEMEQTWSCYEGGSQPCGKCLACEKREEAMRVSVQQKI